MSRTFRSILVVFSAVVSVAVAIEARLPQRYKMHPKHPRSCLALPGRPARRRIFSAQLVIRNAPGVEPDRIYLSSIFAVIFRLPLSPGFLRRSLRKYHRYRFIAIDGRGVKVLLENRIVKKNKKNEFHDKYVQKIRLLYGDSEVFGYNFNRTQILINQKQKSWPFKFYRKS